MSLKKFNEKYNALLNSLDIDYSDYRSTYDTAVSISHYNWELALEVMINIVVSNPFCFDERIRDRIFIDIESEGNYNTYRYIKECLGKETVEDVIDYLESMKISLEKKYALLDIQLNPEVK